MTQAEFYALNPGATITDLSGATGTIKEVRKGRSPDSFASLRWSTRSSDSVINSTDPIVSKLQPAGPAFGPVEYVEFVQQSNDTSAGFTGGMKYRFLAPGRVVGAHVWVGPGVVSYAGLNVGLWLPDGTLLAKANTPALSSGWTDVFYATPVAVTANTTYMVTIYWPDDAGFERATQPIRALGTTSIMPVQTGNVRALAQNEDGHQGFYIGGDGFPTNQWVGIIPVLSPLFQANG